MPTEIDKNNLPELAKEYLELTKTDEEIGSTESDAYLIRILIDKVNELVVKVNDLSNN